MAIKNTCKILLALGIKSRSVYEDCFEKPFLDESTEFFKVRTLFDIFLLLTQDCSVDATIIVLDYFHFTSCIGLLPFHSDGTSGCNFSEFSTNWGGCKL